MRNSCGVRVTSHEAVRDTEASYNGLDRQAPHPATLKLAGRRALEGEPPGAPADIYLTKAEALSVKRTVERESTSHTPTNSHPTTPRWWVGSGRPASRRGELIPPHARALAGVLGLSEALAEAPSGGK
jgi:hypothetical protein